MIFNSPKAKQLLLENWSNFVSVRLLLQQALAEEIQHQIDTLPGLEGVIESQVTKLAESALTTLFNNFKASLDGTGSPSPVTYLPPHD